MNIVIVWKETLSVSSDVIVFVATAIIVMQTGKNALLIFQWCSLSEQTSYTYRGYHFNFLWGQILNHKQLPSQAMEV